MWITYEVETENIQHYILHYPSHQQEHTVTATLQQSYGENNEATKESENEHYKGTLHKL